MIALVALITGAVLVLVIGAAVFTWMDTPHVVSWLVLMATGLVIFGTFLLILTEILLLFGRKEDRRLAFRDLAYLVPTLIVGIGLWFVVRHYLL